MKQISEYKANFFVKKKITIRKLLNSGHVLTSLIMKLKKILTFFVLQNVMMLLIYHNTFVAFTFTIPERKTKKTFISEGLSEIWIKDPQQRPKGHSNPRKMSIYHISSDRNSLDNLGGRLIKFMFSKKATKNWKKSISFEIA